MERVGKIQVEREGVEVVAGKKIRRIFLPATRGSGGSFNRTLFAPELERWGIIDVNFPQLSFRTNKKKYNKIFQNFILFFFQNQKFLIFYFFTSMLRFKKIKIIKIFDFSFLS